MTKHLYLGQCTEEKQERRRGLTLLGPSSVLEIADRGPSKESHESAILEETRVSDLVQPM